MWGALIGAAAGAIGSGIMGRSNAKQQQQATREMYQNRYQWTMQDLAKAGLNPMLAMNQGAVSGGGSMAGATTPDGGSAVAQGLAAGTQKALVASTAKQQASQADLNESLADKAKMEANTENWRTLQAASAAEIALAEAASVRRDPEAVFRSKYMGHAAREIQNVYDLTTSSAKAVGDGIKGTWRDLRAAQKADEVEREWRRSNKNK